MHFRSFDERFLLPNFGYSVTLPVLRRKQAWLREASFNQGCRTASDFACSAASGSAADQLGQLRPVAISRPST